MKKLHLPNLYIEYEVKNANGKTIEKGKMKSQTWVGNIVGLLSSMLALWSSGTSGGYHLGRSDLIDVTGASRPFALGASSASPVLGGAAPAGDTTAGIIVGSSDAPVAIGQFAIQGLIAHGTGSGQLLYSATSVETMTKNSTWMFRVVRSFSNSSGATVTVKEFALYVRVGTTASPFYASVMLARDVPPSAISVPNGSTLTVRYIISHSIS